MKKKQMIKITGIVVVIIAIAGTTAFAGTSSIKVTTQAIGSAGITQNVEAEGHIESEQEKVYYAGVSAPIASFSLENGDMVQTGEQLVSYDTEDLDRSVIQADIQAKALAAGYAGSVQQSKELKQAYQDAQTLDVTPTTSTTPTTACRNPSARAVSIWGWKTSTRLAPSASPAICGRPRSSTNRAIPSSRAR